MIQEEKFNILLVEDNTAYQKIFKRAIETAINAEVRIAPDGQEAMDVLLGPIPMDLLLLDLDLPIMSGEKILEKVRMDHTFDAMRIIIITGKADLEKKMEILDQGANDYIMKDSSPGIMIARIKTQIRHKIALTRLNRMAMDRDLFAAGVLHDIRNIETTIRIVCEFTSMKLAKDPLACKDEIGQNLDLLITAASKLGHYASDVIKSVRMTDRPVILEAINTAELMDWAADLMTTRTNENTFEKLKWEAKRDLQDVWGDRDFLNLAIFNIVQNAVKYSPPGSAPKLDICQEIVKRSEKSMEKPKIITKIRDYGRGVPENELKKIFEPFRRGSNEKNDGGFGLGLSMVTKVISRMGGKVWAELPENGPGLVICIELMLPEL